MPRADVGAAALPAAAAGLLILALLFGHGTSDSRLFWIGLAALLVASVAVVWQPRSVNVTAALFLVFLGGLVLWQAATIAWSIEPAASWDYANRGLVYFALGGSGGLLVCAARRRRRAGRGWPGFARVRARRPCRSCRRRRSSPSSRGRCRGSRTTACRIRRASATARSSVRSLSSGESSPAPPRGSRLRASRTSRSVV